MNAKLTTAALAGIIFVGIQVPAEEKSTGSGSMEVLHSTLTNKTENTRNDATGKSQINAGIRGKSSKIEDSGITNK